MKRKIFIVICAIFLNFNSEVLAQNYSGSIGVRLGVPIGGSAKYFVSEIFAVEAIIAQSWEGISLTSLIKKHFPVISRTPLYAYFGAGSHVGYWDNNAPWVENKIKQTIFGINAIIGLEYLILEAPFSVSADWMPALRFSSSNRLDLGQLGISTRYYFR